MFLKLTLLYIESPRSQTQLATKKIKYSRKHFKVGEKYTFDVGAMLGWPKLFNTNKQTEVEAICSEEDAPPVQWIGPNKDTFYQEWIDEPFQKHPITGENVWFNHSQVFHWTTFPMELWHSFKRIHDIRLLIRFLVISLFAFIKYGLLGFKMALDTTFGDGTPISLKEMNEVRAAIHKNMVFSRWQKGDILCIDNFSTSHGRQPTFDKGRTVIVAWSHSHDKTMAVSQPLEGTVVSMAVSKKLNNSQETEAEVPDLMESPDVSPLSTLTQEEARELQESFMDAKILGHQLTSALLKSSGGLEDSTKHKRLSSCPDLFQKDFWKA